MRVADFSFELPESLIAHYPMPERSSCRLLSLGPDVTKATPILSVQRE